MKYTAAVAQIVGGEDGEHWSQTYANSPLFVVAEVWGEQAVESGKTFLENIQTRSKTSLPTTLAEFQHFLESCVPENPPLAYTAGLVHEDFLYLTIGRSGRVYVKRGDKTSSLLVKEGSASGRLQVADLVILASEGLAQTITPEEMTQLLKSGHPREIAEALGPKLHGGVGVPVAAGVILEILPGVKVRSPLVLGHFLTNLKTRLDGIKDLVGGRRIKVKPLGLVVVLLVVLLAGSIGWGVRKQQLQTRQKALNLKLIEWSHKYEEGLALVELNPVRSRELLTEVKQALEIELGQEQTPNSSVTDFLQKVKTGLLSAYKRTDVALAPFFELELVKAQGEGEALALYEDNLAVYDSRNTAVYLVSLTTKASRIVAGSLPAKAIAIHGEEIYLAADKVVRVSGKRTTPETVLESDAEWGQLQAISAYAGNIYLLDTGKNQIWKYIRTETGYSSRQNYLAADINVDFSTASKILIDASIWITKAGEILKFTQGRQDNFRLQGLDEPLGGQTMIYIDDTTKNLYILDADKKRVVVVDKDGVYQAQYHWQEEAEITDLVVSEALKKMLLLSHGTIYGIDLK